MVFGKLIRHQLVKSIEKFINIGNNNLYINIQRGVSIMRKLNKKATLSISIGAIVVIVIAFVVLGLGLTLTRTIFKGSGEKVVDIITDIDIGKEASAAEPIIVSDQINIKRGDSKGLEVYFYNKLPGGLQNVYIDIEGCQSFSEEVTSDILNASKPTIESLSQTAPSGESIGYKVGLIENRYPIGRYICLITATDGNTTFETKQVYLTVTS